MRGVVFAPCSADAVLAHTRLLRLPAISASRSSEAPAHPTAVLCAHVHLQGIVSFGSAINHTAEEVKLPRFPMDSLEFVARSLPALPQLPPAMALHSVYPYTQLLPKDKKDMVRTFSHFRFRSCVCGFARGCDLL